MDLEKLFNDDDEVLDGPTEQAVSPIIKSAPQVTFLFPKLRLTLLQIPKPPDPRPNCRFVGLMNQGATCYLNSLIQAMYMTPELKFGLYSIDPMELGADIVR